MSNHRLNKTLLFLVFVTGAMACKKSGTEVTANNSMQPGLSASTNTLNYTIADSASNAVTFSYTPTNFGYNAAINYSLQFSYNDSAFSQVTDYTLTGSTMSFTVASFNTLALGLKYQAGIKDTVLVRVKASAADSLYTYSDTLGIIVSPYAQPRVIAYPFVFVPGGYQGWDFNHSDGSLPAVIAKLYNTGKQSDSIYDGYVLIMDTANAANQFKVAATANWDINYGSADSKLNGGTLLLNSSDNLTVKPAGYYLIHADFPSLKWTATLQNWSIIGDAADGWSAPADDVAFDFDDTDQVLVKTLNLKVGDLKFVMNGSFTVSYGIQKDPNDNSKDLPVSPLGEVPISTANNDNIPITEAGTYKITLDLRVPSEPYCTIVKQ